MRKSLLKHVASVFLLGTSLVVSTACDHKPATTTAATTTAPAADSTHAAVAMAYVCPMGCEGSASNSPGKCPVCEMDLEPNPDFKPVAQ
ncbi:heavy metal-binding domain-containing protein [Hymenobacter norwichensis]|uniref:heavy metal-binding domain-containing protein n=1 Tax=Hymenobacter norwichensis TaxID=223903 RepID=UPI0012FBA437|nr:heavy metal-binding domain-containing protein [Hymenobacter norwichensis]